MIVVEMVLAPCQGTHFNVLHLQDTVQILLQQHVVHYAFSSHVCTTSLALLAKLPSRLLIDA